MHNIYKQRREELIGKLPRNSSILIPGADTVYRNSDSSFAFRQESSFYYFSGFSEAGSLMLISNINNEIKSTIFVPEKDKTKEIWDGFRYGPKGAVETFLFDHAFTNQETEEILPDLIHGSEKLYFAFGKKAGFDEQVIKWVKKANSKDRHAQNINLIDASSLIGNMRLIKDEDEINIIKKACDISANAHIEAMRHVKPGMNEQELEAFYLYNFAKDGGRFAAYTPIVAGGANACVLHYVKNDEELKDQKLLLVDAGCEYEMYASDITRTYPVGGKFTQEQLAIYKIVLEAHKESINQVKIGNNIMDAQHKSEEVILKGLIEIGILEGEYEDLMSKGAHKEFYMHKVGHWLGLDVHDAGDYTEEDDHMKYKAGMITTIEPGIYIGEDANVDEKWKGIGVRIEDDILVTNEGNENLTSKVPVDPHEIEALMA